MSAGRITKSIYGQPAFQDIQNFNWTTDDSEFIGGKVGETQASGQTMASVFEIPINGSIRPIAIIVLGSLNNHADTAVLLNHIRSLYQ
jgi:D-alanyl-D-alanine carboxypeptidase